MSDQPSIKRSEVFLIIALGFTVAFNTSPGITEKTVSLFLATGYFIAALITSFKAL